jgi:hypothetical protein
VVVSPVTLKPRFNPYVTAAPPPLPPDVLPGEVDPRQASLFGATWTAGCLRALGTAGAASVTLYETAGWRGILERAAGSPLPALFPSVPGGVFPLWHVLADLAEGAGADLVRTTSTDRLTAEALAFKSSGCLFLLAVNHKTTPQRVRIEGLPERIEVSVLDETTVTDAMSEPEAFRARAIQRQTKNGTLEIELGPCATFRARAV